MLIGNKQDLIDDIQVESEEGSELAQENNCLSFLTSAKMNVGVFESLDETMKKYVNKYGVEALLTVKKHSVIDNNNNKKKNIKCC